MRRGLLGLGLAAALALLATAGCAGRVPRSGEEQALVDRAALAVNEVFGEGNDRLNAARLLRRARAVVVCPRVFKAGFFFGGEGGACVLVGRDAAGSWSSPAFYSIRSGSFGLQAGIQDLQIVMLVMNDRALTAVLDDQLKFGADASLAVATLGGSVEASTTAAVGADILAFARARGLYAGLTLEGSLLAARSEWNRSYYRQDVSPRQIAVGMQAHNPGADPLRAALLRYGSGGAGVATAPPPPPAGTGYDGGGGGLPPVAGSTVGSGPMRGGTVERTPLPPMR
jgi:SH3 domain-containing YSC84-like protein 1